MMKQSEGMVCVCVALSFWGVFDPEHSPPPCKECSNVRFRVTQRLFFISLFSFFLFFSLQHADLSVINTIYRLMVAHSQQNVTIVVQHGITSGSQHPLNLPPSLLFYVFGD